MLLFLRIASHAQRGSSVFAAVFAVVCVVMAAWLIGNAAPARAAELQTLEIISRNGVHPFAVELAVTPEEQAKGLMFRRELPEGRGMLFDFHRDQNLEFWMKNTYISLDMIFIRSDGTITRIAANTPPLSEDRISSGGPARAVLEVIAGTARKLGIAAGDRVAHPMFSGR